MATAWTVAEYTALKAAIASGVLRVAYQDRTVQYQSLEEMRALLREMEQAVGLDTSTRYTVASHSRD